jgi:peptidoglycan-associated lipoprotein
MRRIILALIPVIVGVSVASAQQRPDDAAFVVPRFDISLGYNHMNANAPPGQTNYFGVNGGYVGGDLHLMDWLSVTGQVTGGHANDISLLGQDLTLMTYTAGPKVSLTGHRLVPFGQVLFGGAHGSDSYFPSGTTSSTSASSWALSTGGGLDVNLTRRFAIRAVDADFLRTALPNGSSNSQNHLMIGAGLVIKFGERDSPSTPVRMAADKASGIQLSCDTDASSVQAGEAVQVVGHALTEPDGARVNYAWSSSGGRIVGSGSAIVINTTGMAAGNYRVVGHANVASSPSTKAECDATFHVNTQSSATGAIDSTRGETDWDRTPASKKEAVFHANVQDALFDYDSADIRPDAQTAIEHAAQYLKDNPSIRVLVGGYADERGSAEYNLALGEERANAARNALIGEGVDPERIQVISFGKEAQVCTAENEACWQQNRRAAFSLHP